MTVTNLNDVERIGLELFKRLKPIAKADVVRLNAHFKEPGRKYTLVDEDERANLCMFLELTGTKLKVSPYLILDNQGQRLANWEKRLAHLERVESVENLTSLRLFGWSSKIKTAFNYCTVDPELKEQRSKRIPKLNRHGVEYNAQTWDFQMMPELTKEILEEYSKVLFRVEG